jgi:spermidine synthase
MNLTVLALSAAILALEVVLMRIFSIAQWHHFASMIISIALLGFGLSGTVFSIWRERFVARHRVLFPTFTAGFFALAPLCVWVAGRIPFNPHLVVWQPSHLWILPAIYLVLLLPFTAGALAIALALARARHGRSVGRTYAANLVGSGLGAVAGLGLCFLPLPARVSEYKSLPTTLAMAGSRSVQTVHHPLGRVDVVEAPALRIAPGLSLGYTGPMPPQHALFVDADGGSALCRAGWDEARMAFLEWLPSALPYRLHAERKTLVIGVGGGAELQQALRFGVPQVTGVEMHPVVADIAGRTLAESAPPGQTASRAQIVVADGRAFVRAGDETWDLIQISLLDSFAATAAGIGAANESYLYTVEALEEFIARLSQTGLLCITRWLKTPPRDNIKLFATAVESLRRAGVGQPDRHLALVRGWSTATLLVKRTPLTDAEIARIRQWADERIMDVDYFPGATESDVNLRHVMDEPEYYRAAQELLFGDAAAFYRDHLFNVRPATDNRPYFFHFFRWRSAPHFVRTLGTEWVPFVEWGYVVLVATLAQAVLASAALIGLPLIGRARRRAARKDWDACGAVVETRQATAAWPTLIYFGCLGLGFMLVEIAMFQKFILFLGHPLYSAALVIATFLVFAGIGAAQTGQRVWDGRLPAMLIVLIGAVWLAALPVVFGWLLGRPDAVRWAATVMLLAPLAFFMGMMFPLGLSRIAPSSLPWAWAVNGCFSVIGAVLAAVLAMDWGFAAVIVTGLALYAVAGLLFKRLG